MPRALLIDAKNRTITPYVYTGLESAQSAVGGLISGAMELPNGDYLFVNDEGLFMFDDFFFIDGASQGFAGNGLLVGPEVGDEVRDVQTTFDELCNMVEFASRFEIHRELDRQIATLASGG